MAVQSEQQKNDYAQTVFYADRLLKADPKNAFALVTLASETARHTRENDLDKDEQLAKVDKWAKDAHRSGEGDAQSLAPMFRMPTGKLSRRIWKRRVMRLLGMADVVRKNYEGAATNYKQALAIGASPNPATLVRLAQVYMSTGKLDDADFTLDKAINSTRRSGAS